MVGVSPSGGLNSSPFVTPSPSQSAAFHAKSGVEISANTNEHGSLGSVGVSPSGGLNSSPFVTPSPSQSANK